MTTQVIVLNGTSSSGKVTPGARIIVDDVFLGGAASRQPSRPDGS